MRYLLWILTPLLFLFFVTLALKNLDAVPVRYFLGYEWRAPLIFVLLVFFVVGAVLGVVATLGHIVRQRREIALLKRELNTLREPEPEPAPPDLTGL